MHAYSFTRLRAGAPSRREPWGAGKNRLSGNEIPRVWAKGSLSEGAPAKRVGESSREVRHSFLSDR